MYLRIVYFIYIILLHAYTENSDTETQYKSEREGGLIARAISYRQPLLRGLMNGEI